MKPTKKILSFLSIGILSLLLVGRGDRLNSIQIERPSIATPSTQLTVSAASSLKDVMEKIKPLYQQEHFETEIIYLVEFFNTPEAQTIFEEYGFDVVGGS